MISLVKLHLTVRADLEVDTLLTLEDANELTGDDAALVNKLVEGVLPIGTRLSKVYLTRLERQPRPVNGNSFAIALHRHLHRYSSKPVSSLS